MQTYFIRTYGCQMNELDSEIMAGVLQKRGLIKASDETYADLLIYNTCSIRDLAERKVLGKLGKHCSSNKKKQIIGITGCMASSKKETLFEKLPGIDFVLGTNNIHELNLILDELLSGSSRCLKADPRFTHELDYTQTLRNSHVTAHVSIIRGCNKHCTYCVVPYTRGPEVSRNPADIIDECQALIDKGYKEITLLGQNVDSFGVDHPEWNCRFHDLLYRLDVLAQRSCRIRFMTSHPVDITQELMMAIRDLPSVCEFVHFPLQSGSDRILKKMNRRYTKAEYMEKVVQLRKIVPNVALGTDIIVGFPTETDEEFEETRKALEDLRFSVAFLFTYSPRKGTPAMRFVDDISKEKKNERLQILLDAQEDIYTYERQCLVGSVQEVLVECPSMKNESMLKGRTRTWKNVVFEGPSHLIGQFCKVQITGFANQTLLGTIIM